MSRGGTVRSTAASATAAIVGACLLVLGAPSCGERDAPPTAVEDAESVPLLRDPDTVVFVPTEPPENPLEEADLPAVARVVARLMRGEKVDASSAPRRLSEPSQGVYAAVRRRGRRLHHAERAERTVLEDLRGALREARNGAAEHGGEPADVVEIGLAHSFQALDAKKDQRKLRSNIHRGVRGLFLDPPGRPALRYYPTQMIASNRSFEKQIEEAGRELARRNATTGIVLGHFEAEQILVFLGDRPRAVLMERGNRFVPLEAVTRDGTENLAHLMETWLRNAVQPDGRLVYKYWPARERESQNNNMIRQWMATVALGRVAAADPDRPDAWALAELNIDHNLARFYREEHGRGLIEWQGKVKLGALALAALALVEHRSRAKWAKQEQALRRTIDALWHPDGRFDSWVRKPRGAREQPNYYPGEALLLWATLYVDEQDPALLDRYMQSFRYYREWHLTESNRNPAFVPWHTQAHYRVWTITRDPGLRDFVFEMNDWLLSMQQWDTARYRDCRGRFYDPARSGFGPPHASSTGVYVEGLVRAYRMARAVEDDRRADAYRRAIVRGLRSLMQLQFADEVDMYYVRQRKRVLGGLRTTVYNSEIRCDNVQHGLMGVLDVLDAFENDDFRD